MEVVPILLLVVSVHYIWTNMLSEKQRKLLSDEGKEIKGRAKEFVRKD